MSSSNETNKWINVLAYIWILFFVPLIVDKNNQDYKFHANQGLILFLFNIIINIVGLIIPFIGKSVIIPVGGLICFVLSIMGIVNAINEQNKELPIIGKYTLIK